MFSSDICELPLDAMDRWLDAFLKNRPIPFYSSVDIRLSEHKVAVVDANLFPAGFNNLHDDDRSMVSKQMAAFINGLPHPVKHIVLVPEEHTRNTWYLENVYQLSVCLTSVGFVVTIATFLENDPAYCASTDRIVVETAKGNSVTLRCLHQLLLDYQAGRHAIDLAILNNDLTAGLPAIIGGLPFPVIPSPLLGWHQRKKSSHFNHVLSITRQMAEQLGFNPSLITCQHRVVDQVDITNDADRDRLAASVDDLIAALTNPGAAGKDAPLVFLKSDSGTYGMGVVSVSTAQDVLDLNRKSRNKLLKGKGSSPISQFILQEGVPSHLVVDGDIGEICAYQIGSKTVGGFYRLNKSKSGRDNLNSSGMHFLPISWHNQHGDPDALFLRQLCDVLAKLSVAAISLEIQSI